MTTFIIIVLILLVVGYFFTKKSSNNTQVKVNTSEAIEKSPKTVKNKSEKQLYKKKSIREFDITGTYHLKLDPNKIKGNFIGYAACTENSHDKYAVGIYNNDGVQLGYVPKGNNILHASLQEWYDGKVVAWGDLSYDTFEKKKWYGRVYIPVKYSLVEIAKLQEFLNLRHLNDEQIKSKVNTTDEYFEILERHKKIKKNLQDLKTPQNLYYYFPKNILPSISKHLEKQKEWEKLVELEAYKDLIYDLNDQFRATTERRIELAKSKL